MSENGGTFDLVILGAGSGGYAAAIRASELGMKVALIEKNKLGGTCLHVGCIPTKALLHSAEVADAARDSETFGVKADFQGIDMPGVNAYKDKVVNRMYRGLTGLIKSHGITVVEGEGRLTGPDEVTVGGAVYKGANILLATGSAPKTLGLDIDGEKVITSEQALEMQSVPASVVVLGGGVIGVEFASVYRSYGAEVTIVEALPHLLPLEDESTSKQLERAFRKRGIKYELGTPFESVKTTDSGVSVSLKGGKSLEADVLLVAIGRGPVSEGLGYEDNGVRMERGFVAVDENLHTGVGNIYAVGDLIPTLQLAHVGFAEGIYVAEQIAGLNPPAIDYDGVPRITYSEPEVASVGLTSAKAKEKGYETVELDYNLGGNGKSQILQTQGSVKVIAQKDGPVLGVHMIGSRVGELTAEGQLIYNWEALPSEVAQLVHPHPTQSEALGEAHLALAGKPLHVHE
ncbi:dihydrolipoyl dehydrogenase [Streptomonospora wellingtoniae]|uniref:Dihydrolipoyl dehydrogenase n=1 Tax=Streptomonospora wellingtoniae TaxID=3075544 RepID=A0ABU2KP17_9ACTN|nr:dihydrolipoyl dehydrogenase [Streptomonospora sp. DSM 45055]MDT0301024.1 dihydrolipoyl dehydrogenase [Streptomonospora sp. DSM 45055]